MTSGTLSRPTRAGDDTMSATPTARTLLSITALAAATISSQFLARAGGQEPLVATEMATDGVAAADGSENAEPEALGRGPIHEAFAQTYAPDPVPESIVRAEPPAPIDELPPDQKPQGTNVIWIAGYWAWSDEKNDFLWISGGWRDVPPGQQWVPGYWSAADGGHRWIPGFWTGEGDELKHLAAPPPSLEEGPNMAAPSANYFWNPGCWVFRDDRYLWRAGSWMPVREDRIWVPAHYAWTPGGCVFVSGYWDYRLPLRGTLFAPVYFRHPFYLRPGYFFTPRVSVNCGPLLVHLFIRPRHHHYYYGDWYGRSRYRPWITYYGIHRRFDPLFAYYRWHYHRRGHSLHGVIGQWHRFYNYNHHLRPPHAYVGRAAFVKKHKGAHKAHIDHSLLVHNFKKQVGRGDRHHQFSAIDRSRREHYRAGGKRLHEIADKRALDDRLAANKIAGGTRGARAQVPFGRERGQRDGRQRELAITSDSGSDNVRRGNPSRSAARFDERLGNGQLAPNARANAGNPRAPEARTRRRSIRARDNTQPNVAAEQPARTPGANGGRGPRILGRDARPRGPDGQTTTIDTLDQRRRESAAMRRWQSIREQANRRLPTREATPPLSATGPGGRADVDNAARRGTARSLPSRARERATVRRSPIPGRPPGRAAGSDRGGPTTLSERARANPLPRQSVQRQRSLVAPGSTLERRSPGLQSPRAMNLRSAPPRFSPRPPSARPSPRSNIAAPRGGSPRSGPRIRSAPRAVPSNRPSPSNMRRGSSLGRGIPSGMPQRARGGPSRGRR